LLRVTKIVGKGLQGISGKLVLIPQNMVMGRTTCTLAYVNIPWSVNRTVIILTKLEAKEEIYLNASMTT